MNKKIDIPLADMRQHDDALLDLSPLVADDPFDLFGVWYGLAQNGEPSDPNAMALATSDKDNMPNVRMVLLKGFDEKGFVFFTNDQSTKGQELSDNPQASLCFHWKSILKQIRVRGSVERTTSEESDAYFHSRHPISQIGSWVSQQSRTLEGREKMLQEFEAYKEKFIDDTHIPRPPYWNGFRIVPTEIEFWRNGAYRLHDRLVFRRETAQNPWEKVILYP